MRKNLKKFKGKYPDSSPLILDSDLVLLFQALGLASYRALICALMVQKVAHMQAQAKPKQLSLSTEEFLELFCFVGTKTLKRCLFFLREFKIWRNRKYIQKQKRKTYTNIRISWKSIAELAEEVRGRQDLKEMAKRLSDEVA